MAKCFVTGVELPVREAFVLDLGATRRALRDLRQRVSVLERLMEQLGKRDTVEFFDPASGQTKARLDRRLVSATVARALSTAHPEAVLFLAWPQYKERGARLAKKFKHIDTAAANGRPSGPSETEIQGVASVCEQEPSGDEHQA